MTRGSIVTPPPLRLAAPDEHGAPRRLLSGVKPSRASQRHRRYSGKHGASSRVVIVDGEAAVRSYPPLGGCRLRKRIRTRDVTDVPITSTGRLGPVACRPLTTAGTPAKSSVGSARLSRLTWSGCKAGPEAWPAYERRLMRGDDEGGIPARAPTYLEVC